MSLHEVDPIVSKYGAQAITPTQEETNSRMNKLLQHHRKIKRYKYIAYYLVGLSVPYTAAAFGALLCRFIGWVCGAKQNVSASVFVTVIAIVMATPTYFVIAQRLLEDKVCTCEYCRTVLSAQLKRKV